MSSVQLSAATMALVLGARQVFPEDRTGREIPGWRRAPPLPPWWIPRIPAPVLTLWSPVPSRSSVPVPGLPGQNTVTVTTRLSVTVTTGAGPTPTVPPDSGSATLPTAIGPAPSSSGSPGDGTPGSGSGSVSGSGSGSGPSSGSEPGSGTASETLVTDMPTFSGSQPTASNTADGGSSGSTNGDGSNRTLVITLSTVLSVVGLLLIIGAIFLWWRYRRGHFPFARGATPIGDDEIATWKVSRNEKGPLLEGGGGEGAAVGAAAGATGAALGAGAGAAAVMAAGAGARVSSSSNNSANSSSGRSGGRSGGEGPLHTKHGSTSSIKKPPSVIVYSNAQNLGGYRTSTDGSSPRSQASYDTGPSSGLNGKMSFNKILPPAPIQAKAPNARAGLTDESIPGDEPFIISHKRQPSRLSKVPSSLSSTQRRAHVRTRSSRSSSFGDYAYGGSDQQLAQRHSHDYIPRSYGNANWQAHPSNSTPPRLSFSDETS